MATLIINAQKSQWVGSLNYWLYINQANAYANTQSLRKQNATLYLPIAGTAKDLRLVYRNYGNNYAAADSDLSVQLGMRLYSAAGVGQGGGFTAFNGGAAITIPATTAYTSAILPINNVAAGQSIRLSQAVDAGAPIATGTATVSSTTLTATTGIFTAAMVGAYVTDGTNIRRITAYSSSTVVTIDSTVAWTAQAISVGMRVPGTRRENPDVAGGIQRREYGNNLTPITDGSLVTLCASKPGDQYIFYPSLEGKTTAPAVTGLGDSLTQGVGCDYGVNFLQIGGLILGVPVNCSGVGGSGATGIPRKFRELNSSSICNYLHGINDCADAGSAGTTRAAFLTAQSAVMAKNIESMQSHGNKVMLCTLGLYEPDTGGATTLTIAHRKFLNEAIRLKGTFVGATTVTLSDGVTYNITGFGADAICDLASSLETSPGSNIGVTVDGTQVSGIHWGQKGHEVAGAYWATTMAATGWLTANSADYKELIRLDCDGPTTTEGAAFAGRDGDTWTPFVGSNAGASRLQRKEGAIRHNNTSTRAREYLINSQTVGTGTYKYDITLAPWITQTSTNDMGPGFVISAGGNNTVDMYCYKCWFYGPSRFIIQAKNSTTTSGNLLDLNTGFTVAAGDNIRLTGDITLTGTSTTITVNIWRGQTLLRTGTLTADTFSGLQAGGNFGLITPGNGGNNQTAGEYFTRAVVYKYDPVTIGSVTPAHATNQLEVGMTRDLLVTVLDDANNPASGQPVTISLSGSANITAASSGTTNGSGVVRVPFVASAGAAVGDTTTATFTCSAITGTATVSVVSEISGGGGGRKSIPPRRGRS